MKQIYYTLIIFNFCLAQKPVDIAYAKVLEKLNGSVPESFVQEAFLHPELKIHKEIADRFARTYEK